MSTRVFLRFFLLTKSVDFFLNLGRDRALQGQKSDVHRKTKKDRFYLSFSGDPSGNRTPDTVIKSHVLYRLS